MQKQVFREETEIGIECDDGLRSNCLENFSEIEAGQFEGNMTLKVGSVKFVKDAP